MNRRILLRHLMLGIPSGYFLPSLLSSCKKTDLLEDAKFKGDVLIVGAGAAGIYAAQLLISRGISVVVLEASSRPGGRILTNTTFAGMPVELGAEEIHGQRSVFYDMVKSFYPDRILPEPGENYYWLENQLRDEQFVLENSDLQGAGQTLFQINESFGSYEGADKPVSQYLEEFPLDERFSLIANALIGNEYGTSVNRMGMYALREAEAQYSSGEDGYFLKKGSMWDVFEVACKDALATVKYNHIVSQIDYSGSQVSVRTTNNETFTASRVLVTVPITQLQNNSIEFLPALPADKTNAIQSIKMGAGMKIVLKFASPFWNSDTGSIIGGTVVPEYWVTAQGKSTTDFLLTAFVMGEQAEYLQGLTDGEIESAILTELNQMFPASSPSALFQQKLIQNWSNVPFIGGAYSFPSPQSTGQREILARPEAGMLFFAGEATNFNGHLATVHGAMESGFRACKEILES